MSLLYAGWAAQWAMRPKGSRRLWARRGQEGTVWEGRKGAAAAAVMVVVAVMVAVRAVGVAVVAAVAVAVAVARQAGWR